MAMSLICWPIAAVTVSASLGAPLPLVPYNTGDEASSSSYPTKKNSLSWMIGPERVTDVISSLKVAKSSPL